MNQFLITEAVDAHLSEFLHEMKKLTFLKVKGTQEAVVAKIENHKSELLEQNTRNYKSVVSQSMSFSRATYGQVKVETGKLIFGKFTPTLAGRDIVYADILR